MNRQFVFYILLFLLLGCDTSNNIVPIGDTYFMKFYGGVGNQRGVSVKATPDGGFIIGGNSTADFGGQSDYLLIKVDGLGNQVWMDIYDFNGTSEDDILTEVLIDGNDFIIAGTSIINNESKMVLMRIDQNGEKSGEPFVIDPLKGLEQQDSISMFRCNGISKTATGDFLVVGPVINQNTRQQGKSLISIVTKDFLGLDPHLFPKNAGPDLVFMKAFEVVNQIDLEINYLIIGNQANGSDSDLRLIQMDKLFEASNTSEEENYTNTKSVDMIKINDSNYRILSASETETYNINSVPNGTGQFVFSSGQRILSDKFFRGVSMNYTTNERFIVASDIKEENSSTTFSSLAETSGSGNINWDRVFGTEFSYSSGEVISLADGSIIYTGTAGLKGQKKVFLIKMKSNGDMK